MRMGGVGAPDIIFNILNLEATTMGRGILLWLLGVPLPIIILLSFMSH